MKINNKIKQFFQGNWGKPTKVDQMSPIQLELFDQEIPKHNKKKKSKRKYVSPWSVCPFCEMLLDKIEVNHDNNDFYVFTVKEYAESCSCGAKLMRNSCPACHYNTWYLDGEYKHQNYGCGFKGVKLYGINKSL